MDPRVAPFSRLLALNTDLLLNCTDGVSDAQARSQPLEGLNSISFLVAHLTDARYTLLAELGGSLDNPLASVLADAKGIDDVGELPPLAHLEDAWRAVGMALDAQLEAVAPDVLDEPSSQKYPGTDPSRLGALAFLTQHDSYHLGQCALLRRALKLPAMRYTRRASVRD